MKTTRFFCITAFMAMVAMSDVICAMTLPSENSETPASYTFMVYGDIPVAKTVFEENHYLGDAISTKWNTFIANYTYTYDVEVGLSNTGTELRKPVVYKAVERANKYVKKALKSGRMSNDEAVAIMSHTLDCANVICFEDETVEFEAAAKAAKTGEEVVALFRKVKLEKF